MPTPTPRPTTAAGASGLGSILADPRSALFAFDFDGVLAPIVADPTQSPPHPRAVPALAELAGHVGTVAIISGRPAAVVVAYGGFSAYPALRDLVVFGHYGRERWSAATGVVAPPESPAIVEARELLPAVLAGLDLDGLYLEEKGSSLAVHTRRCADPQAALERITRPLTEFATARDLVVEPGRLVVELRPPGTDKGTTLRGIVELTGARSVAYTGDDLGDLSAFAAIDAMRKDGVAGLKICSGSAEVVEVAREADLIVDGPDGVVALMEAIVMEIVGQFHERAS